MKPWFTVAALLSALTAGAQSVYLIPPGPDSATPIEFRVSAWCEPGPASATLMGSLVRVEFAPKSGLCGDPPFLDPYSAGFLDPLPPGQYQVEAPNSGGTTPVTTSFVVRNAAPPFAVHPFAIPTGPEPRVQLVIPGGAALCPQNACTLRVGTAAAEKSIAGADLVVTPPQLAAGLYDVTIERAGAEALVHRAGVYFFSRNAPPDLSVFERVLFPILTRTPGANGSEWRTEAVLANPNAWEVETYNDIQPIVCVTYPCGERLRAKQVVKFDGGSYPRGVALLVPRGEADRLPFALRARDTSRLAEGFGTEIPVVREEHMIRDAQIVLPDVPLAAKYRAKLRVYAFDPFPTNAGPAAVATLVRAGRTPTKIGAQMTRECSPRNCPSTPVYAEMDIPNGPADERVDVYVELPEESIGWAFITVTNNETQEVTIVTPGGRYGPRCEESYNCEELGS